MPFIIWDESFSVKIKAVDDQHQKLFEIANQFYDALVARRPREAMALLFKQLIEYTAYHFDFEEKYFDEFQYDGTSAHKIAHTNLVSQVVDMKTRFEEGGFVFPIEISRFLRSWLTEHIKKTDVKYTACFQRHGLK